MDRSRLLGRSGRLLLGVTDRRVGPEGHGLVAVVPGRCAVGRVVAGRSQLGVVVQGTPLARGVRIAPLDLGLTAPERLHELVELIAHRRG